jgi:hypothetical protein
MSYLPIVILILWLVVPTAVLWAIARRNAARSGGGVTFYRLGIGGSKFLIPASALASAILWVFPILAVSEFMSYVTPTLFFVLIALLLTRGKETHAPIAEKSRELVGSLKRMQSEIAQVTDHVERLALEVEARRIELEASEKARSSLVAEIDEKLAELNEWKALNNSQKKLVLGAAREALNRRSTFQMSTIVLGSVLINLLANVIWAMLGQPGGDELHQLFQGQAGRP